MAWTITQHDVSYSADADSRTYTVVYRAVESAKSAAPRTQQAVAAVIAAYPPGTTYSHGADADAWVWARFPTACKREKRENSQAYLVTVPYTNKPLDTDQQSQIDNPLLKPAKISGSFLKRMEAAVKDRNGAILANSANEPWIPAPEIYASDDTVVIEKNTATIDLGVRASMRGRVNSAAIWGLGTREVRMDQWHWEIVHYALGSTYVKNRWELSVNTDKWNEKRFDEGFRIKAGVIGGKQTYTTLMDDRDQPLREPRLLDGAGGLLAAADAPVELTKEVLPQADFTTITGFPDPLF